MSQIARTAHSSDDLRTKATPPNDPLSWQAGFLQRLRSIHEFLRKGWIGVGSIGIKILPEAMSRQVYVNTLTSHEHGFNQNLHCKVP